MGIRSQAFFATSDRLTYCSLTTSSVLGLTVLYASRAYRARPSARGHGSANVRIRAGQAPGLDVIPKEENTRVTSDGWAAKGDGLEGARRVANVLAAAMQLPESELPNDRLVSGTGRCYCQRVNVRRREALPAAGSRVCFDDAGRPGPCKDARAQSNLPALRLANGRAPKAEVKSAISSDSMSSGSRFGAARHATSKVPLSPSCQM